MKNKKIIAAIVFLLVLLSGYFMLDSFLFDGIRPQEIKENGFQGNFYTHKDTYKSAAVVLIGGGQWGDYWAQEFAKNGYSGLSLPYYGREGLPELMEEIPLEYFETAIGWLRQQPGVDADKIILMGASRNAELALVTGATLPGLSGGVIAYAPSALTWSNTVLAFNSDIVKPSWTYHGEAIPYVRMEKIAAPDSDTIHTETYWEKGLSKNPKGIIPVENIRGPVLLFSGKDDEVWPSAKMADMIAQRLKEKNFGYTFQNIQYDDAGHLISGNPDFLATKRTGTMLIEGKEYKFNYGGTAKGDQQAQIDARKKVFEFIASI